MDQLSAHLDRSWDLVSKGETTQALVSARRALDLNGDAPEVHNLLGYIYAVDGDYDEALACYRRALELDEWYLDPMLNAAEILVNPEADPEEAIRLCRMALEVASTPEEMTDASLIEIEALMNLARVDEAALRLAEVGSAEALSPPYLVLVGRLHYEMGNMVEAKRFSEKALAADDTLPDAWYYAGLVARDEGRRIDAVVAFLATRERDLAMASPPWTASRPSLGESVTKALEALPSDALAMLDGSTILIEPYPSERQIRDEMDPRQVVLVEGVDPARRVFEKLWVFSRNVERAVPTAASLAADLAYFIEREVTTSRGEDAADGPEEPDRGAGRV
ncbi:MAG: tetratricopeptide repeat protein [Deltaproteobacteria bacterium]|nr:tetratricopeptide repeat protein [Deltaproteobacteria bacterium]